MIHLINFFKILINIINLKGTCLDSINKKCLITGIIPNC